MNTYKRLRLSTIHLVVFGLAFAARLIENDWSTYGYASVLISVIVQLALYPMGTAVEFRLLSMKDEQ